MRTAVLLLAHGAASSVEEVPAYLRRIFGERPVRDELVEAISERYRRIGGGSPHVEIARRQAEALSRRLGCPVELGMRYSEPTIREAVDALRGRGAERVVVAALTPYFSEWSTGRYREGFEAAERESGARWETARLDSWHLRPELIAGFAERVSESLARLPRGSEPVVIFAAHSIPAKAAEEGDPYPRQFAETAERVARRLKLPSWELAYQSRSPGKEPWLGPEVGESLGRLAREGRRSVALAPIGFVSDHLETLYDDDVLYREQARSLKIAFERTPSLNDSPPVIEALAAALEPLLRGTSSTRRS